MSQAADILSQIPPFPVGVRSNISHLSTVANTTVLPQSIEVLPPSSTVSDKTKSLIIQKLLPDKHRFNPTVLLSEVSSLLAQHDQDVSLAFLSRSNHPLGSLQKLSESSQSGFSSESLIQENIPCIKQVCTDKKRSEVNNDLRKEIGVQNFVSGYVDATSANITDSLTNHVVVQPGSLSPLNNVNHIFERIIKVLPETRSEITLESLSNFKPTSSHGAANSDSKELFKCEECEYSSHNKHYLKQHLDLVHSAERPFKCPFCDYAGKRSHSLREHLIVHSNERPFACTHCNATFRKKGHLTNHTKLHTSHRPAATPSCPICGKSFDLPELESHVKLVHSISRLYACEFCEFLAVDQLPVIEHMKVHAQQQVYVCSECDFHTASYGIFVEHAESHVDDIDKKDGDRNVVNDSPSKGSAQSVLMKCTECGFTSSESQTMKSHMWQHINKGTSDSNSAPVKHVGADNSIESQSTCIEDNSESMYRCGECRFQCRQASVFVSHIFSHQPFIKTEDHTLREFPTSSAVPVYKVLPVSKDGECMSVGQINPYKVMPVTMETSCYNPDTVGFVHDQAAARFRCTICGYTCEYQRTIKAHVWKHSGHKDIDYPMFQNGPLSIYDETQAAVGNGSTPTASPHSLGTGVQTNLSTSMISPVAHALANKLAAKAVAHMKLSSQSSISDKEVDKSLQSNTIDKTISEDNSAKKLSREIKTVLVQMPNVNTKATKTYPQTDDKPKHIRMTISNDSSAKNDEVGNNDQICCVSDSALSQTNKVFSIHIVPESPLKTTGTKRHADMEDANIITKQPCHENPDMVNVVVEAVDSINTVSSFTGMHSQQNSPRLIEVSTSPGPAELITPPDKGVIAHNKKTEHGFEREELGLSEVEIHLTQGVHRLTTHSNQELPNSEQVVPDFEQDVPDKEVESPLVIDEDQKGADSESATILLSLLKKGPNFNPACPRTDVTTHLQQENAIEQTNMEMGADLGDRDFCKTEDSDESTHSGSSKPKAGISSSLLAVIEQLREKSQLDDVIDLSALGVPATKKTGKRKSRKDSVDDASVSSIDDLENVEVIEELDGNRYRCKLCHYTNSGIFLIRQHMRLHKTKMPFECSLCDFVAVSSENLQDHMIQHCKVRTYQCKLCPSAFNYKSQLRAHMRAHNEKNPFLCDFCEFETTNPIVYHNHLRSHAERKQYKCEACKEGFVTKYSLRIHKRETCLKQRSLCCDECDFEATGTQELKNHSRSHKQFRCSKCDFSTSSIAQFRDHVHMHEETKPLKCDMCDFTAVSNRSLKSHMKRHINDQRFVQQPLEQYKCNLCGYVCHHLPSLKSHMWRHVSNRNYSYEFTNEVINAAIDYDSRLDPQENHQADILEFNQIITKKLKDKLGMESLAEAAKLLEMPSAVSVCWVTFRCCQCGFETINKAELSAHMKSHSDVIRWTLEVSHNSPQQQDDSNADSGGDEPDSHVNMSTLVD